MKQIKFIVLWKLEPNDDIDFEADVMATSYREAKEKFQQLFPHDHVVTVERAPTRMAA